MTSFKDFRMQMPASSSYWEAKFISTSTPNTLETVNGKLLPASNIVLDVGQLQYEQVDIFADKLFFIKNIDILNKINITYIEDEQLTITKFHKDWIFSKNNNNKLYRDSTPNVLKDFAETIQIKKYASDFKTLLFEMEAVVIPDDSISFTFDWDDSVLEKSFTYQVLRIIKFEFYGNKEAPSISMSV